MTNKSSSFFRIAQLGNNSFGVYAVGFIAIVMGYFIGQIPFTVILGIAINKNLKDGEDFNEVLASFTEDMNFGRFGIDSNIGFILMLLTFIGALIALYLIVTKVHKKKFIHLIKPNGKLKWSKMLFCFLLWIGLTACFELGLHFSGHNEYTFQFNIWSFIPLVLISLLILPLQTSFEEFFFRGYYLQAFGLICGNKWLPLIITSVLFGMVHSANPEVMKYGFYNMQFYYITVGLFLGILTILDDSLEIALGIHAATNFYGACLVGYEGSAIQTASVFKSSDLDTTIMTVGFIILALIFYLIVSFKYKLPSIRYLFDKLNFNENITTTA